MSIYTCKDESPSTTTEDKRSDAIHLAEKLEPDPAAELGRADCEGDPAMEVKEVPAGVVEFEVEFEADTTAYSEGVV